MTRKVPPPATVLPEAPATPVLPFQRPSPLTRSSKVLSADYRRAAEAGEFKGCPFCEDRGRVSTFVAIEPQRLKKQARVVHRATFSACAHTVKV